MKHLIFLVFGIVIGIFLSECVEINTRLKFEHWSKTHKPNIGMPVSELDTFIRNPITYLSSCAD